MNIYGQIVDNLVSKPTELGIFHNEVREFVVIVRVEVTIWAWIHPLFGPNSSKGMLGPLYLFQAKRAQNDLWRLVPGTWEPSHFGL